MTPLPLLPPPPSRLTPLPVLTLPCGHSQMQELQAKLLLGEAAASASASAAGPAALAAGGAGHGQGGPHPHSRDVLLSAPLPPHWEPMAGGGLGTVHYFVLPLPGGWAAVGSW